MEMTASVCNICKDAVWSFICPDCLAEGVRQWLPAGMAGGFSRFHDSLLQSFYYNPDAAFEYCVKCNALRDASICPFCYMTEAYNWLKGLDPEMAYRIYKFLPLANDWKVTECDGCVWKAGFEPLVEGDSDQTSRGQCDQCEEYSDSLVMGNGEWLCTECADGGG